MQRLMRWAGLAGLLVLCGAPARAGELTGPIEEISFDRLLAPVEAAAKREQEQWMAPSAVSVISRDEIDRYGYHSLIDALVSLRGVYGTYDREYHYLGIRGFGMPGDYSNRVLLLVDGARTNDAIYQESTVGPSFFLDMSLVDKIELARGPSSAMYGTSALFGVINVVPKQGKDLRGIKTEVDLGSLGYHRVFLAYGDSYANGLDVLVAGTYRPTQGADALYFEEFDDPATRDGWARGLDREDVMQAYASAAYRGLKLQLGFGLRKKRVPTASYGAIFGDPGLYDKDTHTAASLQYQRKLPWNLELLLRGTYNRTTFEGEWPYDVREAESDPLLRLLNRDEATGQFWSSEVQLARKWGEWLRLTLGAEVQHDFQQDQMNYDIEPWALYLDSNEATLLAGAYLDGELKLFKRLVFDLGVRYDYYFDAWGGTWSPRGALIYRPLERTYLKLMAGTAFRGPNAYERFYSYGDPASGNAQILNGNLQPERILTTEALVEHWFNPHVRAQVGGYFYRMTDLIQLVTQHDEVLMFENSGKTTAFGVEAELEGRWKGLRGRASYSYQRAQNEEEELLVNSPAHMAKAQLLLPIYGERVSLGAEALFTSARRMLLGGETRPVLLGNLVFYARDLLPGFEFSGGVHNIADMNYLDPAGAANRQAGIPQDGRTFWLRAGYLLSL